MRERIKRLITVFMTIFTLRVHLGLLRAGRNISTQAVTFHKNTADNLQDAVDVGTTGLPEARAEDAAPPG